METSLCCQQLALLPEDHAADVLHNEIAMHGIGVLCSQERLT
jgi:hypothetical protein